MKSLTTDRIMRIKTYIEVSKAQPTNHAVLYI
jgi:hypothetical protein